MISNVLLYGICNRSRIICIWVCICKCCLLFNSLKIDRWFNCNIGSKLIVNKIFVIIKYFVLNL